MSSDLNGPVLRAELLGGLWTSVEVVASTGSTNPDLLARVGAERDADAAEYEGAAWLEAVGVVADPDTGHVHAAATSE